MQKALSRNRRPRRPVAAWAALAPLAAALVLALAAGSAAQEGGELAPQPTAAFGERIEVELVAIEVWVTGRDGRPVHGLTADDFTVRHDGEPVEPTYFSEVRSGDPVAAPPVPIAAEAGAGVGADSDSGEAPAAPPPAAAQADAALTGAAVPGHLVVYFDQLRLAPGGYQAMRRALDQVLADAELPADRVLVLRQDENLHLEAPFGSSPAEVAAAVERSMAGAHRGLAGASRVQQAKDALLAIWEESEQLAGSAASGIGSIPGTAGGDSPTSFGGPRAAVSSTGRGSLAPPACDLFQQRSQPVLDAWMRDQAAHTTTTLSNLANAGGLLSSLPGVKTLVYVSDSLDLAPGAALVSYAADFCPGRGREKELRALGEGLTREFRALAGHLNARHVTLHAIQASGLRADRSGAASERARNEPKGAGVRFDTRQRAAERSGMAMLAEETGGRAVFNRSDLAGDLAAIGRDMGNYYSLAYEPPVGHDGASRIAVAVDDPRLTVRYRRGVRPGDSEEAMDEGLAGALHLGVTRNPHDLRLGLGELPEPGSLRSGETVPLRLYAMVPVDALVFTAREEGEVARVELRGSVQGAGDAAPPEALAREFLLRKTPGAEGQRVSLPLELDLEPGAYRVAVALRDAASGETSFVTTAFEIGGG